MQDTLINHDGTETETWTLRPECQHLGERTFNQAKSTCNPSRFAPVYRCNIHRLCSPFAKTVDPDLIPTCEGCRDYQSPK